MVAKSPFRNFEERLGIHVYGLSAMYSEPYIVGSVISILSEKSQDTSCGGGNEARGRLNNLASPTVGQSSLGNLCGPVELKMWDSLFKKQEKAFIFL